ncbi:PotD/PotF family extracellular solute-binding protein [Mangrovicoccus sp. HB161399]|uniref:ABC transporter substrate-binding protein n=1 Tax=Mangrovicoccus sp. HB161399 TaxID=2720392 RepID=UPI0015568DFD|nr:extracellular solute-binding protein [Mangrovicoccus sp. HB161399]
MTDKFSRAAMGRRAFLGTAAAAALSIGALPRGALAASGRLVVSNWGGDWNDNIVAEMERPAFGSGPIEIVHDLAPVAERKTRLLAERRLPRSSVDVSWLSDSDAFEMNQQGVLEELDYSLLPNAAALQEKLKAPYYIPAIFGAVCVLYNPAKIATPPTSFADLWNPALAGRVGLMDQIYFNYIYAASLVAGGTMSDVEPAFAKLMELKAAVAPRIYPSHQALAAAFQSEEIWISANYSARGRQWQADGIPLELAFPEEGGIAIAFGAGIPKKAANREAAYAYLDAMLAPEAMAGVARSTHYAVSTTDAALAPEEKQALEFSGAQIAGLNFVDYPYAAEHDSDWLEWWNREFKA